MDNYIVSARKYRPSTFESVVGQQALTQTLRNAIRTNHLAHAYLFCGPRGVGKTTCARIFAKTINCLNPTADHDACNECESCRAFNEQRSFNIHELDAASNNSVDDIRSIIEQVQIPPQMGKYSVYIIDEVHMLSPSAFNALLKTLEEPPSYAIFILATTEKHKVIPTILSRCQVFDFARITINDTIHHLQYVAKQEGIDVSEEALNVVAQKADGGMRDALSIFDQLVSFCGNHITYEQAIEVLNVLNYDYYFQLVDAALQAQPTQVLLILDDVLQHGFDAGNFIVGLAKHLRDVMVSKDPATIKLLETSESIRQRYLEQAQRCSARWLLKALDVMNTCDINYRTARNKRLTVELALVKLTQLLTPDTPTQPTQPTPKPQPQPVAKATTAPVAVPTATTKTAPTTSVTPMTSATKPAPTQAPTHTPKLPSLGGIGLIGKTPTTTAQAAPTTQEAPTTPTTQTTPTLRETPYTPQQLADVWHRLQQNFPDDARLQAVLSSTTPEILNPRLCRITVANTLLKQEFSKFGRQIMDIVRDKLQNDYLKLLVEVEDHQTQTRAYTTSEKYKELLKQNPQLQTLRDKLDLSLD